LTLNDPHIEFAYLKYIFPIVHDLTRAFSYTLLLFN